VYIAFENMITLLFLLLATDFTLKAFDCPETEYPAKIVNTAQGCLWYKKDNKFKIPKGEIK
jgi:nardilysin